MGSIVGKGADEGARLKAKFLAAVPALANLIDDLKAKFERDGFVRGLDGRKLYIGASKRVGRDGSERWERSLHKALNTLLQSAGAIVMKKALVLLDERLQAEGLVPGKHYEFILNVHDEFGIECDEGLEERVGQMARQAIIDAGVHFKMRCPLDGEYKLGSNWAQTH